MAEQRRRSPRPAPASAPPNCSHEQDRGGALQHVAEQRRGREALAAGAQHVGRADIAGADGADVARAREPGQDQAERDRAEQIADGQRDERCEDSGHVPIPMQASVSHVFVDRPAGDDGAHDAALHPGLVERRVLAFRFQLVADRAPRARRDRSRSRRPARRRASVPPGRPSNSAGRVDSALSSVHQRDLAVVHQPQAGGQHGLDADGAGRGFGERQALDLDVLRVVVGHHDVDQAFARPRPTSALRSSSARSGGDILKKVR